MPWLRTAQNATARLRANRCSTRRVARELPQAARAARQAEATPRPHTTQLSEETSRDESVVH